MPFKSAAGLPACACMLAGMRPAHTCQLAVTPTGSLLRHCSLAMKTGCTVSAGAQQQRHLQLLRPTAHLQMQQQQQLALVLAQTPLLLLSATATPPAGVRSLS